MSVAPNLCCDETKNRGIYTHMTNPRMIELMPTSISISCLKYLSGAPPEMYLLVGAVVGRREDECLWGACHVFRSRQTTVLFLLFSC